MMSDRQFYSQNSDLDAKPNNLTSTSWNKIKEENINYNDVSPPYSYSFKSFQKNTPKTMNAIVQTKIPTEEKQCQTDYKVRQLENACQTSSELNECKKCAQNSIKNKNVSTQTESLELNHSKTIVLTCDTSSEVGLTNEENQNLTIFQDLVILNSVVDSIRKQQHFLISNTRNDHIKGFLRNIYDQHFRNFESNIKNFIQQMIACDVNTTISDVCPKRLTNTLWKRYEQFLQSGQVKKDQFINITETNIRAALLRKSQHLNASTTVLTTNSSVPLSGGYNTSAFLDNSSYAISNNLISSKQICYNPSLPSIPSVAPPTPMSQPLPPPPPLQPSTISEPYCYFPYLQPVQRNMGISSANPHDLPLLSPSDIQEEIWKEQSKRYGYY